MDGSITPTLARADQCRRNAQERSTKKRAAAFEALATLQREGHTLSQAALARRAGVSTVFLRSHPDLLQALEEAEKTRPFPHPGADLRDQARDTVIAALRRRVDALHAALQAKELALRHKQREIDRLYGKLAAKSPLLPAELQQQYQEMLQRLMQREDEALTHEK
ncbi:MAG: hypothetical protein NVSMB65_03590 [Chloroflexota bacterium]